MALQVYATNGYVFLNDEDNLMMKDDAGKNVTVNCSTPVSDRDDGTKFILNSPRIGTVEIAPEDIVDENDVAYTLESWIEFYTTHTGNFRTAGGGSPAVLPPGTYTPKNAVSGAFDLLWSDATETLSTDSGSVTKTSGTPGFNAGANFAIATVGAFSLSFQIVGMDIFAGVTYCELNDNYTDIQYAFSTSGTTYYLYSNGNSLTSFGGYLVTDTQRIDRLTDRVEFYVNDVLKHTVYTATTVENANGHMLFDCSINPVGGQIDSIALQIN